MRYSTREWKANTRLSEMRDVVSEMREMTTAIAS